MKKILLATTVLAMSATVGAADVTLSGDARMGVTNNNFYRETAFTSRARVSFKMSGETDGGLTFGAKFRADKADSAASGMAGSVFISGAFGKLAMSGNSSAASELVGNVSGVGLTGLNDENELGYVGTYTSVPTIVYTYSAGALTVALSAKEPSWGDGKSVAVKYAGEGFSVALGFEDEQSITQTTVGVSGSVGGMGLSLVAARTSSNPQMDYAISVDYSADALGVTAFFADKGLSNAYGLGASYDLGGGAKIVGGVVKTSSASAVADLGISMSF